MSFKIALKPKVRSTISTWRLPDVVLVEALLQLRQLENNPARNLQRVNEPFDGLIYYFDFVDPQNRLHEYQFAFQVGYSVDEETLFVIDGVCVRHFVGEK